MKLSIISTPASVPKTKESEQVAYLYASILIVLVLCQLFTFDKFLVLLGSFYLPGGQLVAHLVGSLIVISEVFALPFLLGLKLSPLMRFVSMIFGWVAPIAWFTLSIYLVVAVTNVQNIGFLGTVVDLLPGWWSVYVSIALTILAAWSSWGLWPGKHS